MYQMDDVSRGWRDEWTESRPMMYVLLATCTAAAILLIYLPPLLVVGVVVGMGCAWIAVTRPFYGLLIYLVFEYVRIGEIIPALGMLHPARIVAILTIIGWLLAQRKTREQMVVWSPQSWVMLGFIAAMIVSITTAMYKSQAVEVTIAGIQTGIVFFLITNLGTTKERVRQIYWLLLLLGLWLAVGAIKAYVLTGNPVKGPGSGFLSDENDLALGLVVVTPMAWSLYQAAARSGQRALAGFSSVAIAVAVVLTFSRGGFIGLIFVLTAIAVAAKRRFFSIAFLAVVITVAWNLAPPQYRERIASIRHYREDESAQARMYTWQAAELMFRDRPFFGVGAGNFSTAYGLKYRPPEAHTMWRATHSIYYECLAELGAAGCIFFCALIALTYRDLIKVVRMRPAGAKSAWEQRVALGTAIALSGYLVGGAFLSALFYIHPYLLAALAVCLERTAREHAGVQRIGGES